MNDDEKVHILDVRVARLEEQYKAKEKALELIAISLTDYKAQANEWRGTVQDIIGKNPTRVEVQATFDRLSDKVSVLERAENKSEGKSSGFNASWLIAVGVATLVLMAGGIVVALIFRAH